VIVRCQAAPQALESTALSRKLFDAEHAPNRLCSTTNIAESDEIWRCSRGVFGMLGDPSN